MLQVSIFIGLLVFFCQKLDANPPELPPRFQKAIINIILTPRKKPSDYSSQKLSKKHHISYGAIQLAEQIYTNELFSFAFMPDVSPEYTGILTSNVSFLRDFVAQNGPCKHPQDYLSLLFLSQKCLEEALGISIPTTPVKKHKKKSRQSADHHWRQVLSDFECIRRLCNQFKLLMDPADIVALGKKQMRTHILDYDGALTNEDYPLEKLTAQTKKLSLAADAFHKNLISIKRNNHIIFETKARHLKLFKKILLRYLKEIPNSAFLKFPDYWKARNACKKKRIDDVITAINDWSDELIEQEFDFLMLLRKQPDSRRKSSFFEPGCFGTEPNEGIE